MSLAIKAARGGATAPVNYRANRGDPGLFGFLGKAIGTVTGIASKVLPGPLGSVAGLVSRTVTPRASVDPVRRVALPAARVLPGPSQPLRLPALRINGQGRNFLQNGGGGAVVTQQALKERTMEQPGVQDGVTVYRDDALVTQCPKGMRPNKAPYFEFSEQIGAVVFHPTGTKCVPYRRRNPLNPRAFDRALGRITSAKRFGEKLSRVSVRSKCSCPKARRKK